MVFICFFYTQQFVNIRNLKLIFILKFSFELDKLQNKVLI